MNLPRPRFDGRLGARLVHGGVRFAVHASPGGRARLLLFADADAPAPDRVIDLDPVRDRTGSCWHVFVPGAGPGQCYNWSLSDGADGRQVDRTRALLDPYGLGVAGWSRYERRAAAAPGDNTARALRSVVVDPDRYDWGDDAPPSLPGREFIYETHVGAFTADPSSGLDAELRGTYAGLAARADHLVALGVTAVELLPVHAFDPQDAPVGLSNYWGYSPLSWFAPHPGYAADDDPAAVVDEFRDMVRSLHAKGLRIYLDVVYNHTAESGPEGPDLCWRGFDEDAYYMRESGFDRYRDFTGCGNTINANHPVTRRLITDSLRWWVRHMHVDGFRFDLAGTHVRDEEGEPLKRPPLIGSIDSDPVLADTRLIAEAWDTGGLHLVGDYPGPRFACWNGPFRDTARRFLRGDPGVIEELMARVVGSPDLFQRPGDRPSASVNFFTCHDGFSLRDLVSYERKHNLENGEDNRDGSDNNLSWHSGVEGPTDDPAISALRERRMRNFIVLLFFSHGTPMLLGGDEWGQTRDGNNNPWCQDNELNWLDWRLARENADLMRFVARVAALSNRLAVLADDRFWSASSPGYVGDIAWHGRLPGKPDWSSTSRHLGWELIPPRGHEHVLISLNAEKSDIPFTLPSPPQGTRWHRIIDTGAVPLSECFRDPGDPVEDGVPVPMPPHTAMVWRTALND